MKKNILLLSLFLLSYTVMTAQLPDSIVFDVIRIKLTPEAAELIAEKHNHSTCIEMGRNSEFSTGILSLDILCKELKVYKAQRIFPYSRKFENRHKKAGLHQWYELFIESNRNFSTSFQKLQNDANIIHVEPALDIITYDGLPANDELLSTQWHYNNTGQTGGKPGADINLFEAWEHTMGSEKVIVAIMDQGIDLTHIDLKNNLWVNEAEAGGVDGEDDDENGYIDDIHGWNFFTNSNNIRPGSHGTHVAGTVGAESNNEIGVSGIAGGSGKGDGVRLMSCQIMGGGKSTASAHATAFIYAADNGAVIAQCSWGHSIKGYYEQAVLEAIDYFIENAGKDKNGDPLPETMMNGGIVFFAAGNESSPGMWWPACYENVYAVLALDHNNKVTSYTNYDTWIDICAPGGERSKQEIISTLPANSYGGNHGTSMACPHISGVAALLLSKYGSPEYTPEQLWKRMQAGCVSVDDTNPSYAEYLGAGLINAGLAMNVIINEPPVSTGMQDTIIYLEESPILIDLNNIFSDPDGDILSYSIESFDNEIVSALLVGNQLEITGLKPGVSKMIIRATDPAEAFTADSCNITVLDNVYITPTANLDINIYPNPAGDKLYLDFNEFHKKEVELTIMDISGKVHMAQKNSGKNIFSMNISGLKDGIYLLLIRTDKTIHTVKFVKRL